MSPVSTAVKVTRGVVGGCAHAVTHPISSAGYAVGLARGAVAYVRGQRTPGEPGADAGPVTPTPATTSAPPDAHTEPAPQRAPAPPVAEPSATEPKSPSRNAAHGGPGDATVDDWREEIEGGPDVETPVGTTGAGPGHNPDTGETDLQQPGTEPLMDPSLTKAIKSESETLQKAADPPAKSKD